MDGIKIQGADFGKQSLMTVLNKFVEAVKTMDDRVMVPCRLRDMDITGTATLECAEENNNMSVLPIGSKGEDLYSYYVMINAIKHEVLSGNGPADSATGGSDAEMDSDNSDDGSLDAARKTGQAFRHHVQGLFSLLNQLTDTAKYLGDAYEEQIGSSKKCKKFAI